MVIILKNQIRNTLLCRVAEQRVFVFFICLEDFHSISNNVCDKISFCTKTLLYATLLKITVISSIFVQITFMANLFKKFKNILKRFHF